MITLCADADCPYMEDAKEVFKIKCCSTLQHKVGRSFATPVARMLMIIYTYDKCIVQWTNIFIETLISVITLQKFVSAFPHSDIQYGGIQSLDGTGL